MPEISRFFGIIITMNYNDHAPPHLLEDWRLARESAPLNRIAPLE